MTYGRILYNNIKEYTPKWFKTIPYSQTTKPTFVRQAQVQSSISANPNVKSFWRLWGSTVQRFPWAWQVFIFCLAFGWMHIVYDPYLFLYRMNNKHRTLEAAMEVEKAHKRKLREQEEKENAE